MAPDPVDFCIAQDMVSLRVDQSRVNPKYLFAVLRSPQIQSKIVRMHVGTLIPHFKKGDFDKLLLPIPNPRLQRFIGEFYFLLSSKMDLNQRTIETLEGITRALFKSWLIDFDPVRAKAGGHELAFPEPISNLFPDTFEASELGQIPKGWGPVELGSLMTSTKSRIGQDEAPEYSATVTGLTLRNGQFNKQLSKSKEKNKRIKSGDLVFGLSRQVLNFGLMRDEIGSVSPVYEVFGVDRQKCIPELLENLIRENMAAFLDVLKPAAREGQAIDRRHLLNKRVSLPPHNVQEALWAALYPYIQGTNSLRSQSAILCKIRDALLPKLISGELRISHADQSLGGGKP